MRKTAGIANRISRRGFLGASMAAVTAAGLGAGRGWAGQDAAAARTP
ncbi:MAG: hypothetical protein H6R32_11, partial [Candidatus Aminicenantes bacterium]|nr:hypothetical protein [Candidatus Aminicenantes bacterium]